MKQYSFIKIDLLRNREGFSLERDYRQVIHEQAKEGWHFEQAISFESHTQPRLELVFSRKVSGI